MDLASEIAKLKKDRDKSWADGRQYLKDGQKAAAQRCLQACRASEMLMSKLEMKRWVFEQLLSKLELAKSDQDFSQALNAINTVVRIAPEAVADVLGEVSYAELKSGHIKVLEKDVPTASLSSYYKATQIAATLKDWISRGQFFLTEPVAPLPGVEAGITFKPLEEHSI